MRRTRYLLLELARWIEEEGVPYAIIGGVAVNRYGFQRATKDIDHLVDPAGSERLGQRLESEGFGPAAGVPGEFRVYVRRRGRGRIDLLDASNAYKRRIRHARSVVEMEGRTLSFARIEDVIGLKLLALANDPGRRKGIDDRDIRELFSRATAEDRSKIEHVLRIFGREDIV